MASDGSTDTTADSLIPWGRMRQVALADASDPDLSPRLADYQNRYWWMDPTVIWSLAKSGLPASHPDAQAAAIGAAHIAATQQFGYSMPGDPQPQIVQQQATPDLTAAGAAFDKLSGRTAAATGTPSSYAAGPSGPLQIIFGSYWDKLPANVRDQLKGVTLEPIDPANKPQGVDANTMQLYKLGGTYGELSSDNQRMIDEITAKYAEGKNLDGALLNISPNGGTIHGPTTDHASPDSTPYLAFSQATKPDTSGPQIGGYDVTDLGSLTAAARGVGIIASAGFQELSGQVRNLYQALSPMGQDSRQGAEQRDILLGTQHTPEQLAALPDSQLGTAPDFTAPKWTESQSDLGIIVGDLAHGRPVNTGEGFFVNPEAATPPGQQNVGQERLRREAQRGQINGHSVTLGRWLIGANNSTPDRVLSGMIDLTLALKADPAILAMKGYSATKTNAALFHEAGSVTAALDTWRQTGEIRPALQTFFDKGGFGSLNGAVNADVARSWAVGPEAAQQRELLAANDDAYSLWVRATGRRNPLYAAQLAAEDNPDEIGKMMVDHLGVDMPKLSPTDLTGGNRTWDLGLNAPDSGTPVFQADTPARWRSMLPDRVLSPDDLNAHAVALERFASAEKMPTEWLSGKFDELVATSPEMRNGFWQGIASDFARQMVEEKGLTRDQAAAVTRMVLNPARDNAVFSMDQVARGLGSFDDTVVSDGVTHVLQSNPHLDVQHYNGNIYLPDWRGIRHVLGPAAPIWQFEMAGVKPAVLADRMLTYGQNQVWKMLEVLTPKTVAKIMGDSQGAIAARGYISSYNHPFEYLGIVAGDKGMELPGDPGFINRLRAVTADQVYWDSPEIATPLGPVKAPIRVAKAAVKGAVESGLKAIGVEPLLTHDEFGEQFAAQRELQGLFGRGIETDTSDPLGARESNEWDLFPKPTTVEDIGGAAYKRAIARDISQLASSGDAVGVMRQPTLAAAKEWYFSGEGNYWRQRQIKVWGHPEMADRATSDQWVQNTWDQVMAKTNGNPGLVNAFATGKLDGIDLWRAAPDGSARVNPDFRDHLAANYWGDLPTVSRGPRLINGQEKGMLDRWFNRAVHTLLSKPDATFDKSPLYRQVRWNKLIDKAPFLDAEGQAKLLENAQGASLPNEMMGRLTEALDRNPAAAGEGVPLKTVGDAAHHEAIDMVRKTLHDFSERNQLMDGLKLISPFGEVLRKTMNRWIDVIKENPYVLRRVGQGVQAGRSPEVGALTGSPPGQGFFRQDQYGQWVFTIPFTGAINQALTGENVPLTGNVKGLTVAADFLPTLGPVMSFPVSFGMEKLGASKPITDTVFPYGEPKGWNNLKPFLPTWMQNALASYDNQSPDTIKAWNYATVDYLRVGVANGEYNMATAEGMQKAVDDASAKALTMSFIRSAANFLIPGAPKPEFLAKDQGGKMFNVAVLVNEFHKMENGDYPGIDRTNAGQKFIEQYGTDVFQAITPKSFSYIYGLPTTAESLQWVTDHPDVKRDAPNVYGYFAPPSKTEDFDPSIYADQLAPEAGKIALTPHQWLLMANAAVASLTYRNLRAQAEAQNGGKPFSPNQNAWLRDQKQMLIDRYPGYSQSLYGGNALPQRPDALKVLVPEVLKIANDPAVQQSDAGQGLAAFVPFLQQADQGWTTSRSDPSAASATGWYSSQNPYAVEIRAWVRAQAAQVTAAHPNFGPLFDNVFDRAMWNDAPPTTPGGG